MKVYDHPEGEAHPRAPSHLKKIERYDFGEELLGDVREVLGNFVSSKDLESNGSQSLGAQLRDFIYHKENRREYVDFANAYLNNKEICHKTEYDVILVGAGIHAALFLYRAKKINPDLRVLVIEKSSHLCSTFFELGDSLVLNSPTFSKVGLNSNIVQGHFIQVSDFDELYDKPFPTAKHIYELAVMIFFHADADILFESEVKDIIKKKDKYLVLSEKLKLKGQNILISTGMGEPKKTSFKKDKTSKKIIFADDFISLSFKDKSFIKKVKGKRIAVVGGGDTANCVMEYLLPLVYPNNYYGIGPEGLFLPKLIHWIGQPAESIQDYFFANKSRYCHSGGVIEFFWHEETPFELSTEVWKRTKELIHCIPDKLLSISHQGKYINLETSSGSLEVDLLIDCTGRFEKLSKKILQHREYSFIEKDIKLYGGQWDEELERFIVEPRLLKSKKIACKIQGEKIFFIGSSCPLDSLIEDDEARDGSLRFQEERKSLTNSKWSLEHTLPRTAAFADCHQEIFLL